MPEKTALEEQIRTMLSEQEKHAQMLEDLIEIVKESGSNGVKDRIKQWIVDIKNEEGLS